MGRARLRHHLPSGPLFAIASALLLLLAALLVYFDAYDIAAGPHL